MMDLRRTDQQYTDDPYRSVSSRDRCYQFVSCVRPKRIVVNTEWPKNIEFRWTVFVLLREGHSGMYKVKVLGQFKA